MQQKSNIWSEIDLGHNEKPTEFVVLGKNITLKDLETVFSPASKDTKIPLKVFSPFGDKSYIDGYLTNINSEKSYEEAFRSLKTLLSTPRPKIFDSNCPHCSLSINCYDSQVSKLWPGKCTMKSDIPSKR